MSDEVKLSREDALEIGCMLTHLGSIVEAFYDDKQLEDRISDQTLRLMKKWIGDRKEDPNVLYRKMQELKPQNYMSRSSDVHLEYD